MEALLECDQGGGHQERPVDVGVLEQARGAKVAVAGERLPAREVQLERERAEHRRRDGREHVGDDDLPCAPARAHVGAQPQREHAQVERDPQELDGAGGADGVDRGDEVEGQEDRHRHGHRERHPPDVEAARGGRDDDDDREEAVGRRGLELDDREQQEADRDGRVVVGDRQGQRAQQPHAAGEQQRQADGVAAGDDPQGEAEHDDGRHQQQPAAQLGPVGAREGDAAHARIMADGARCPAARSLSRVPGARWSRCDRRAAACGARGRPWPPSVPAG